MGLGHLLLEIVDFLMCFLTLDAHRIEKQHALETWLQKTIGFGHFLLEILDLLMGILTVGAHRIKKTAYFGDLFSKHAWVFGTFCSNLSAPQGFFSLWMQGRRRDPEALLLESVEKPNAFCTFCSKL